MPILMVDASPDECPWGGWAQPNVEWCEEELCGWVVNPADAWSNLAYLVFGLLMVIQARRSGNPRVSLFGPASILVGLGSFAYHASHTYFFQFFDFVGMFIFCFAVITANALRMGWIGIERQWRFLGFGVLFFSLLVPIISETHLPIQMLVAVLVIGILVQEITINARPGLENGGVDYWLYGLAWGLLALAGAFSLADVTRAWCEPSRHWVQGHALWHLLSASSLYVLFLFYRRLSQGAP
ncbi:MAG: ceramidase domain-containing protein [Myxococcota bacterium]|nr:ceramidase domain-containing protein [Myxococcota bacterium]